MMQKDNHLFLEKAVQLSALGVEVEKQRSKIRELINGGVQNSALEMREALEKLQQAEGEWEETKQEHDELLKQFEAETDK